MPAMAAGFVFTHHDRSRLARAMREARDARHCRRLQAVLLVAEGRPAGAVAALLKASRRWVTKTLACYRQRRRPNDLAAKPRAGRPPLGSALSRDLLTGARQADPLAFGYALVGAAAAVSGRTLRHRRHAAGLAGKRPRYVFGAKEPHRAQKKGRSCAA